MRFFITTIVFVFLSTLSVAQSALEVIESGNDLNVLYRNEQTFHGFLGTRGWGFGYRRGKHVTAQLKALFEIEAAYLKHPKEIRIKGISDTKSTFVYGKLNTTMLLRSGIGTQHTLFKRTDRKGEVAFYKISSTDFNGFAVCSFEEGMLSAYTTAK
jgi:hypothetical protein